MKWAQVTVKGVRVATVLVPVPSTRKADAREFVTGLLEKNDEWYFLDDEKEERVFVGVKEYTREPDWEDRENPPEE